jgi:hypothetical protein
MSSKATEETSTPVPSAMTTAMSAATRRVEACHGPDEERRTPDEAPERASSAPATGLPLHESTVDGPVPLYRLAQILGGLLSRVPAGAPARPGHHVRPHATGLAVVVGDVGVQDGEVLLRLLVALGGVRDEAALVRMSETVRSAISMDFSGCLTKTRSTSPHCASK